MVGNKYDSILTIELLCNHHRSSFMNHVMYMEGINRRNESECKLTCFNQYQGVADIRHGFIGVITYFMDRDRLLESGSF